MSRYTLGQRLGAGAVGEVYEATAPDGRSVVLKFLREEFANHEEFRERFLREGEIQRALRHPNIVRVEDVIEARGLPALVVERLYGQDLAATVKARGRLSITQTLAIAGPILDALQAAHEMHIVHRDIKPANIFLHRGEDGRVVPKLMDFGIAKMRMGAALTAAGDFLGTPHYASPDQILGTKDVDGRADVYSFGVVLWELFSGEKAFAQHNNPMAVIMAVIQDGLPPLPDSLPPWIRSTIATALAQEPDRRFQTAAAFRDALRPH